MSTAAPTHADWQIAQPFIDAWNQGAIDRRGYWHGVVPAVKAAHIGYSSHDATRVARIMAPFPLRDGHYAAR